MVKKHLNVEWKKSMENIVKIETQVCFIGFVVEENNDR